MWINIDVDKWWVDTVIADVVESLKQITSVCVFSIRIYLCQHDNDNMLYPVNVIFYGACGKLRENIETRLKEDSQNGVEKSI